MNLAQLAKIIRPEQLTEITTALKDGYIKPAKTNLIPTPVVKENKDKQGIKKFLTGNVALLPIRWGERIVGSRPDIMPLSIVIP